jgi:hypothetical protein
MESENSVEPCGIYDVAHDIQTSGREPEVLVELVIVGGPEGEELHAMQAEVVRRVLTRLAETQKDTKEGSL